MITGGSWRSAWGGGSSMVFVALVLAACNGAPPADGGAAEHRNTRARGQQQSRSAPVAVALPPSEAPDALKTAANRFTRWAPVHDFLDAEFQLGRLVSSDEAIACTGDGHLAVTRDAGRTWSFSQRSAGRIRAVGGAPGGPFVGVGDRGHVVWSPRGREWRTLPRMTGDDLIDLAIQGDTLIALGNHGVIARYRRSGEAESASELPHGFEGRRLVIRDGMFYSIRGPTGYASVDGHIWRKAVAVPSEPSSTSAQTSQGDCVVERLRGSSRVRCTIDGIAYGLDEESAIVIGSEVVALTRSGGLGWDVSVKPMNVVVGAFGPADGPYVLLGERGRVAVSEDGANWRVRVTPTKHQLLTGIVTDEAIVVAGKRGTLLRSMDQGETWTPVPSGTRGTITQLAMVHDRIVAFTGHRSVVSTDGGGSWRRQPQAKPSPKRPRGVHSCGDNLPLAGERCAYTRRVRSPADRPDVYAVDFYGDSGLGYGDSAFLAFTVDGGATWRVHHGVPTARIRTLAVGGPRVLASDGRNAWVSVDGGGTFHSLPIPTSLGPVLDSRVSDDGSLFLVGERGTVLKATMDLTAWIPLSVGGDPATAMTGIHTVESAIYVSDELGRLYRSADAGATWDPVPGTGSGTVLALTGQGQEVLGILEDREMGIAQLVRSTDGGRHFGVVRTLARDRDPTQLHFDGQRLVSGALASDDLGATWTSSPQHHWVGAVRLGDGSGYSLVNQRLADGHQRLLLVGARPEEWVAIDSVPSDGATLRCDAVSGCWMVRSGRLYRPRG